MNSTSAESLLTSSTNAVGMSVADARPQACWVTTGKLAKTAVLRALPVIRVVSRSLPLRAVCDGGDDITFSSRRLRLLRARALMPEAAALPSRFEPNGPDGKRLDGEPSR